MGILTANLFLTLDGVYQAPGGPDEDPDGGFAFGGWQGAFIDDESGAAIGSDLDRLDALLLGRKTYDIFAPYWPQQDGPIAEKFNSVPKFVASNSLTDPTWAGTTVVTDVAGEVPALKQRFTEMQVIGSGRLLQSLLDARLVDRLSLYLYPVFFGQGKRLFEGGVPSSFRLVQPARSFPQGAVSLVYEPAGEPVVGISMDDLE